jgi:hypothetical protein
LNNYIDIPGLNTDEQYKLSVLAVNSLGESDPSVADVKVETEYLAPLIFYTSLLLMVFLSAILLQTKTIFSRFSAQQKPGDYAGC